MIVLLSISVMIMMSDLYDKVVISADRNRLLGHEVQKCLPDIESCQDSDL
jgi:hypothetical protein